MKFMIERLLQVSGVLIILGLLVEIASLLWFHPLAFVLFVFISASLTSVGILIYLASLVFVAKPR
jgi:hypothetical protein